MKNLKCIGIILVFLCMLSWEYCKQGIADFTKAMEEWNTFSNEIVAAWEADRKEKTK